LDEWARNTDRSSWLGHQSRFVRGRPPVFGVGESIAGFSLSLPCAVTESCATGQPAASVLSTPCALEGAFSWVICFPSKLPDHWAVRLAAQSGQVPQ
jgi:hypothetical protein